MGGAHRWPRQLMRAAFWGIDVGPGADQKRLEDGYCDVNWWTQRMKALRI